MLYSIEFWLIVIYIISMLLIMFILTIESKHNKTSISSEHNNESLEDITKEIEYYKQFIRRHHGEKTNI